MFGKFIYCVFSIFLSSVALSPFAANIQALDKYIEDLTFSKFYLTWCYWLIKNVQYNIVISDFEAWMNAEKKQ